MSIDDALADRIGRTNQERIIEAMHMLSGVAKHYKVVAWRSITRQ